MANALRKRLALVTAAALGLGLLTSVPATASSATSGGLTVATIATGDSTATPGADTESDLTGDLQADVFRSGMEDIAILVTRDTALVGSAVKMLFTAAADSDLTLGTAYAADDGVAVSVATNVAADGLDFGAAGTTDGNSVAGGVRTVFELDDDVVTTAGAYAGKVWIDSNGDGLVTSGETVVDFSFTIGGVPTAGTLTFSPTSAEASGTNNVRSTFCFTDTSGYATTLTGAGETLTIADTAAFGDETDWATGASGTRLANGCRYLSLGSGTASTSAYTITATLTPASGSAVTITGSFRVISLENVAVTTTTIYPTNTTGAKASAGYAAFAAAAAGADSISALTTAGTINFELSAAAAGTTGKYLKVVIARAAAAYGVTAETRFVSLGADGKGAFSVTNSTPTVDDSYTVTVTDSGGDGAVYTVTYVTAKPVLSFVSPGSTISAKAAAGVDFVVKAVDAAGYAISGATITVSISGRNPGAKTVTTDASGLATFSTTDPSTASLTDFPSDTVTLNTTDAAGNAATAVAATITYTAAGPSVSTVNLTVTDTDGAATVDTTATDSIMTIDTLETDGVAANYTKIVVTARTSTGAAAASGILCTATGAATDLIGPSTTISGMKAGSFTKTTSSGVTTFYVYSRKAGTSSITVTCGAATANSGTLTWVSDNTAGNHRYVAVSADPATAVSEGIIRITATVTDRWDNPVSGVDVTVSEAGAGRLYAGQAATVATNSTGKSYFDLTSAKGETGDNTVTVSIAGGQSANNAGYVGTKAIAGVLAGKSSASTAVKFTAATATADPTITALTDAVTKMMTALQTQITTMQTSISLLVNSFSATVTKLLNALAKKK